MATPLTMAPQENFKKYDVVDAVAELLQNHSNYSLRFIIQVDLRCKKKTKQQYYIKHKKIMQR